MIRSTARFLGGALLALPIALAPACTDSRRNPEFTAWRYANLRTSGDPSVRELEWRDAPAALVRNSRTSAVFPQAGKVEKVRARAVEWVGPGADAELAAHTFDFATEAGERFEKIAFASVALDLDMGNGTTEERRVDLTLRDGRFWVVLPTAGSSERPPRRLR